MRPRRNDNLAAATKQRVTELEHAQVWPRARAPPDNRLQRLLGRPIRTRLRQDQCRRRCRTRYSRMAMDEKMRALRACQVTTKGQQLLDIRTLRRDATWVGVDNVVKAQLEPPMRVEDAKGLGLRRAGIEKREHVSDPRLAMQAELADPANRDLERHQAP